jgi:hypothetical protein
MKSKSEPSSSQASTPTKPHDSRISHLAHAVWDFIRPQPWVINNIRQRKSQKILFRSWLAGWASLILMLPNQSLQTIGNLFVDFAFLKFVALIVSSRLKGVFRAVIFHVPPPFCPGANLHIRTCQFSKNHTRLLILPGPSWSSNRCSDYWLAGASEQPG